jgi:hypothetical protein
MLHEGFLKRVKFHLFMHTLCKTFNGRDRFSVRALSEIDTRDHRLAIHKDSTRATLGFFTANLCPCEAQSLAEKRRKSLARDGVESVFNVVNYKREFVCH